MSYAPPPPPSPDQVAAWVAAQSAANSVAAIVEHVPSNVISIDAVPTTTVKPAKPKSQVEALATREFEGHTFILQGQRAFTYTMRRLVWLWPERIPAGKITLLTGKPDCGKSLTLLDVIATVSTGRDWPDSKNTMGPRKVLLAAAEDDPEDTIIPRLKASGADLDNVFIVRSTFEVGAVPADPATGTSRALSLTLDRKTSWQR